MEDCQGEVFVKSVAWGLALVLLVLPRPPSDHWVAVSKLYYVVKCDPDCRDLLADLQLSYRRCPCGHEHAQKTDSFVGEPN